MQQLQVKTDLQVNCVNNQLPRKENYIDSPNGTSVFFVGSI